MTPKRTNIISQLDKDQLDTLHYIYDYYSKLGMNHQDIAGIAANIFKESSFRHNSKDSSGYHGYVQMSPDMQQAVINTYGNLNPDTQLQFVYDQITGNSKVKGYTNGAGYQYGKYKTGGDAAEAFRSTFERNKAGRQQSRIDYGNQFYDYFNQRSLKQKVGQQPKPIVLQPVSTAVRQPVPAEQTRHTWTGAENESPYVTGKPVIKLQPRIQLPSLVEMMEDSEWEPPFPQLKPMYKDGKLPYFKDGTRYLWDDQKGGWDRITDSDVANAMAQWAFTPTTTRTKFDYENTPNPIRPLSKNAEVKPDNTLWTRQQVEKANNTRTWRSDAADMFHAMGEGAMLASTFAAPEIESLVYPAYQAAKETALAALRSNTPVMQYMRYPVGKIIYGMDAQFPTLYRKIKSMPTEPVDGTVQISNPGNRFVFTNTREESPIITNFTYDAPVRKHANGNWDSGFTLAMPGRKTLLGKNVISTEPSDLFTYGDNIKVPLKDLTLISGNQDEIALANQYGYKTVTSPKLQQLYQEGNSPGIQFATKSGHKLNLRKQELSAYAKEVENTTRQLFRSPTKNNVDFMNFVLQPKVRGAVYDPNMLDYLINNNIGTFGDRIGNAELRSYLLDPDRWRNIIYDPATHAEAQFRDQMGIGLKKGYKDGKSPIHIKPANRGKLTRLKKRTGKSEAELYRTGGPSVRKMITFARNARKWKH